ncbi:MAG: 4-hydroxyphenylacetate 3-hydroxylase N-terminal domain-containing protein [Thermodesulfobacteriota bacterium]|jgi:aromatic ring hydroxylase
MPLRTAEQYKESLKDNRVVYFRGQRIRDVTQHPLLQIAIDHEATDYRLVADPHFRDLAVVRHPESGEEMSRYFLPPRSAEDLLRRSALIETACREGGALVVLSKVVGSDGLFGLLRTTKRIDAALGTSYHARATAFYDYCRANDLNFALAQTDVKGDRALRPSEQADPDLYLRIVEERPDGIVVRGAKVHTSNTTHANEMIVLPTRAMGEEDKAYAVAFAIPLATKGLTLIMSGYGSYTQRNPFDHPVSATVKMTETLTVFDDVFVSNERIFLKGEWQFAGALALSFVEYHRLTAISYKLPFLDLLVGAARVVAEYNGIEKAAHVRDKLFWLASYAETTRALTHQACIKAVPTELGMVIPNPALVNIAKHHFAAHFHQALSHVQDLAGGILVTGPAVEDVQSEETGPLIEKYLQGKKGTSGKERLQVLNLLQDITASDFGGYQAVLALHAEGSMEAEKLQLYREYDWQKAMAYARRMAGLGEGGAR